MNIAAAYIRVSDERQDEYSPDSQLSLVRQYAKQNEYFIPDAYIFYDDGVSAKSTKGRNQFNEMISLAEQRDPPFKAIIVWKFSRFARNEEDSILLKARLRRNGVSVLSVSERLSENDEYSGLIERFIEWDDAHYLRRLSQEVKRGMLEKASRGEPMSRQYGYDLIKKQLIPNADAAIVRDIFQSYADGEGLRAISQRLGSHGIRTSRGNNPDNRWVEYILRNPVYIGKIRWSKSGRAASKRDYENPDIIVVDGHHEPIITTDLWNAVQKRMDAQKCAYRKYQRKEQTVDWMLKGLVRCSACNATLTYTSTQCPSMQCHNYARGKCPTSHALSVAKANRLVTETLQDAALSLNFAILPRPAVEKEQTDFQKLIDAENRKLQKIKEAYQAGVDTLDEYRNAKQKIMQDIQALETERDAALANKAAPFDPNLYAEKVRSIIDVISNDTVPERTKNEALRSIIAYIIFDKPNRRLNLFFYD